MNIADIPERVVKRVAACAPQEWGEECVDWFLSVGSHGYGQIGWGGAGGERGLVLAHRLSYCMYNGEIPDDMTVDHTCRRRACWNPRHLRLLDNVANATDNGNGRKTHCPRGHPYSGDNLIVRRGARFCRTCDKMWKNGWRVVDNTWEKQSKEK